MLTKKDLSEIDGLMQKRVKKLISSALQEFYETLLLPYFDHNEKDHAEIKKGLMESKEELVEYVKDQENRIRKLEVITAS